MSEKVINKADLIERIAAKGLLTDSQSHQIVNIMLDQISSTVSGGGRVEIRGFGSFSLRAYEPRKARNPKTGETVEVGNRYAPHFKAGVVLRKNIDNSVNG